MSCNEKSKQYIKELEHEKIMMETQFAQLERKLQTEDKKTREELTQILTIFNSTSIQYEQLCADLISFIKIFNIKDKKEIRLYKLDELTDLMAQTVSKFKN